MSEPDSDKEHQGENCSVGRQSSRARHLQKSRLPSIVVDADGVPSEYGYRRDEPLEIDGLTVIDEIRVVASGEKELRREQIRVMKEILAWVRHQQSSNG